MSAKNLVIALMVGITLLTACTTKKGVDSTAGDAEPPNTIPTIFSAWTKSSTPVGINPEARAKMIWYNPYVGFYVSDIYDVEDRSSYIRRVKVLVLRMKPEDTDSNTAMASWAGLLHALPFVSRDQSDAQYLDVRLGTYNRPPGKLHIDLGNISEDIDGDGILDAEDRDITDEYGRVIILRDGLLSSDEDTGLDLVFSEDEPGYDPITNPDPSMDDWQYNNDDPSNYERINGTERNMKLESESLNMDEALDTANAYFSFSVDLTNSEFEVDGSVHTANRISSDLVFRTYRIPLWNQSVDPVYSTNGDSTVIRFARLWLDGMAQESEVFIAAVEFIPDSDSDSTSTP